MKKFSVLLALYFIMVQVVTAQTVTERTINFKEIAAYEAAHPDLFKPCPTCPHKEADGGLNARGAAVMPFPAGANIKMSTPLPKKTSPTDPSPMVPSRAPLQNWLGHVDVGTIIPPDTYGAVGLNHVVTATNNFVKIHAKVGGAQISQVTISAFTGVASTCDPQLFFDPNTQRWIFVAIGCAGVNNSVILMTSNTSDPTGTWRIITFVPLPNGLLDHPYLGYDDTKIVIGGRKFAGGSSFTGPDIYLINKADMLGGVPIVFGTNAQSIVKTSADGDSPRPVTVYFPPYSNTGNPTPGTVYIVQSWNNTSLRLTTITGNIPTAVWNTATPVFPTAPAAEAWTSGNHGSPGSVPQPAPETRRLASNDARVSSAVMMNGDIWCVQHCAFPAGASGVSVTHTDVQYWKLEATGGAGFGGVIQRGRTGAVAGQHRWFGSIAVNKNEDVLIGYSLSDNAAQLPSAAYSTRQASTPVNTLEDPFSFHNGESRYWKDFGSGRARWGDYSQSHLDPVDNSLWTIQEYASLGAGTIPPDNNSRFGTWWAQVAASPSCTAPIVTAPNVTQPTCTTPTGTIVVNASGSGTLEYQLNAGSFQLSNTFTGLAPGNYSITVRLQSSPTCSAVYDGNPVVIVAAPSLPVVNAPTVTQPTCATPTGTIVVNATGGGTLEYSVDNGTTWSLNATFSGLVPNSYNIKVRLQASPACISTYTGNPVVLTAATGCCTPPVVNAPTVTQPTCATPTGTIVVNATGGGTLEYSVDNGTTWSANATFSGLTPNSYNIKVRLQANPNCLSTYTGNPVVLTAATGCCTPPVVNAPTVTQPTCATPTGTIVVNATGGSALEYSVNNGTNWFTSATFSGLAPGNYNIKVRLQNNPACSTAYSGNPVVLNAPTGCSNCIIICPANVIATSEYHSCGTNVSYPPATVSGDCGNGSLTYSMPSGSWFDVGNTVVTVTSPSGATCTFTVTVKDLTNPITNRPQDIYINAAANSCSRIVNFPVSATDNCPGVTVTAVPASGSTFNVGTTPVTITATDASGNTASYTFNVTVDDRQLPVITCPPNVTVGTEPGICKAHVTLTPASATDNCPGVIVTAFRNDFKSLSDYYLPGVTIVTWRATDASGNYRECNQRVTVKDMEAPSITNSSVNPQVLWPPDHTMRIVNVDYNISDNCGSPTSQLSVTSNEAISGTGPGDLSPDWQILDRYTVKLRAERADNGTGRIYTIKITGKDAAGNTTVQNLFVYVPLTNTTSVTENSKELTAELTVQLTPNPSESVFNLLIKGKTNEVVKISVFDITGREIQRMRSGSNDLVRFGDNLMKGTYFVEVRQGKNKVVLKAVKQ